MEERKLAKQQRELREDMRRHKERQQRQHDKKVIQDEFGKGAVASDASTSTVIQGSKSQRPEGTVPQAQGSAEVSS